MRGAKVIFCRERNKYVKKNGVNISVFYTENEEWNSLNSSRSKINKIVQITSYLSPMP